MEYLQWKIQMRSEYFIRNFLAENINRWKNKTADGLFRKNGTTTIWIWKHWNFEKGGSTFFHVVEKRGRRKRNPCPMPLWSDGKGISDYDWGIFFIFVTLDFCLLLIHRDLWNSQKWQILISVNRDLDFFFIFWDSWPETLISWFKVTINKQKSNLNTL